MKKYTFLFVFVLTSCLFVYGDSGKNAHAKEKGEEKEKKDQTSRRQKKPPSDQQQDDDDYDTTQGYPILFPETHMMTLKRNMTTQPNLTLSSNITDIDDELLDQSSNISADERGKCAKAVDLLFLLDSSESVKYSNWKIVIEFVKNLCNRFQLKSTRVGVIRYASEAEVALPLSEFNSTEDRDSAIDDIFYKTGGTRTDIALKKASEILHIEEQRSQVVMLVTDGPTNRLEIDKNHFVEGKDLVAGPASRLKEAGVALFCIGVEPDSETPEEIDTMKDEMNLIASEPTKMHLFMSDGYRELNREVTLISNAACVVNGAWSAWSEFSPCSVTCGYGTKVRMRTCSNPHPENNGADCTGQRVEIEECDLGPCTAASTESKQATAGARQNKVMKNQTHIDYHSEQSHQNQSNDKPVVNGNQTKIDVSTNTTEISNNTYEGAKVHNQTEQLSSVDVKALLTKAEAKNVSINLKVEVHEKTGEPKENKKIDSPVRFKPLTNSCFEGLEEIKLNDSQYMASSIYTHDTDDEYLKKEYAPQNAKLNNQINGGGWCAEHKFASSGDKNQFLQFDLGRKMSIDGVATQGSHLLENWVKKYNLRYSDDSISWEYYSKNPLEGNSDRITVKRNQLSPPVEGRYIQINPIEWNEQNEPEKHDICMRAALLKCKEGAVAPVKRGVIQPYTRVIAETTDKNYNKIPRGVVLKEREWSHLPDQKTVLTLFTERTKRQIHNDAHTKNHKRIFKKLRKTASNMLKKINKKFHG